MLLTKDTTIYTLAHEFPFLIEALAHHNPAYEKLRNSMLRQTMGRIATLEKAAAMGREDLLQLMLFLAGKIMATTGATVEIIPPTVDASAEQVGGLSREQRLEALKAIIHQLHQGADFTSLQQKFTQTVGDITASEIASLEQTLVDEGVAASEIKKMCHLHAALFAKGLEGQEVPAVAPGHPVHTYLQENAKARELLVAIEAELKKTGTQPSATLWSFVVSHLRGLVEELEDIQTHYVRKENQLFPLLEQHNLATPAKVMWAVHDDIRAQFRSSRQLLTGGDPVAARQSVEDLIKAVDDMIGKEERILFPMTLEVLTEDDWGRCRLGDDQIGYAYAVVPGAEWTASVAGSVAKVPDNGLIDLATGQLSIEVINTLLCNLPVDISFVDAEDKVAYYSDSIHRIFPRSPGVIGRDVHNCHPPKSVHMVTEILEAFKKGDQTQAEFWLEIGEKFVHIQYLALWAEGKYLGCLEVGQDATHVRSLSGQRRLLEWKA